MGMMAMILKVRMRKIDKFYLMYRDKTREQKTSRLMSKGIDNTFFIYEYEDFEYFWNLILKNRSNKFAF